MPDAGVQMKTLMKLWRKDWIAKISEQLVNKRIILICAQKFVILSEYNRSSYSPYNIDCYTNGQTHLQSYIYNGLGCQH